MDHDLAILLEHQRAAINKVHVVINHCAVRKTFVRSLRSGVYKACCSIGVPSVHLPPNTLNPKQTMHSLPFVFLVLFSTSSWTEAQSQNTVTFENCSSASLRTCVDDYCVAICDDDGRQVLQAMLYSFKRFPFPRRSSSARGAGRTPPTWTGWQLWHVNRSIALQDLTMLHTQLVIGKLIHVF